MPEHEYEPEERPRHLKEALSIDTLPVVSDDPTVLARWEEGLRRWGRAFRAFTTLRIAELHTDEALTAFENLYLGSYDSMEMLREGQYEALGWNRALDVFRTEQGIESEVLDWNHQNMDRLIQEVFTIVQDNEGVHVFEK